MLVFFRGHSCGKGEVGTPENANGHQAAGSRIPGSPLRLKLNVFGRGPLHTQADCVITHPRPQTSVATESTSQPLERPCAYSDPPCLRWHCCRWLRLPSNPPPAAGRPSTTDRKSTRLNSSH